MCAARVVGSLARWLARDVVDASHAGSQAAVSQPSRGAQGSRGQRRELLGDGR